MTEHLSQTPQANEHRIAMVKELTYKAYTSQVDYGRWVLASLITLHGGAFLLISQTGPALSKGLFAACGLALTTGLVAAVLTGALAWINFTTASQGYAFLLVALINNRDYTANKLLVRVGNISTGLAILAASTSIGSFVWAAHNGYVLLSSAP